MVFTQCPWNSITMVMVPVDPDFYVAVNATGFVSLSYWDGNQFDQNGILFWSNVPTS